MERKRGSRRSLWASRGSEGGPVAVVMASGGDGLRSVRRTEEEEGGPESEGEVRGAGGCVASREGTRGGGGSQAGRRWPGRVAARAGRVPVLLAGRKTTGEGVEMGWAGWAGWWAPGGLQVS